MLTDFKPNKNNQCIPLSEAENIIKSSQYMPLKMNFQNGKEQGHNGSYPVGVLTETWLDTDRIMAKSVMWKSEYQNEDEYLRQATSEGKTFQTSWELLYTDSEIVDGIELLRGCNFAATVIVDNPAYGARTPILAIAEENSTNQISVKDNSMPLETAEKKTAQMDDADMQMFHHLIALLNAFMMDVMEDTPMEMTPEDTMSAIVDKVKSGLDALSAKMKGKQKTYDDMMSEYSSLKEKLEKEKQLSERATKLGQRKKLLSDQGIVISDERSDFILSMSEDIFTQYVADLDSVKKTKASVKDVELPEPIGNQGIGIKELAKEIVKLKERG